MHSRTRIQRSDRQVSCPLREEAAILNMSTGRYYGLDAVGAAIWQRIERPASFGEVNAALLSEYNVTPAVAEQDLLRFFNELAAAGLVEINDDPHEELPLPSRA